MVVDKVTKLAHEIIVGDGIFMCKYRCMQDTENLFDQICRILHLTGNDLIVLFHHKFDQLHDDFPLIGVYDNVHDDSNGFFIHLWLGSV